MCNVRPDPIIPYMSFYSDPKTSNNQFSLIYLIYNDYSVFIMIFPAFTCCI